MVGLKEEDVELGTGRRERDAATGMDRDRGRGGMRGETTGRAEGPAATPTGDRRMGQQPG